MAKYTCDIPTLEDNYIELSDAWSRREVRDFYEFKDEQYLALLQSKLVACYLARPGAEPLTEPVAFDADMMDTLDMRIVHWVAGVPVAHVRGLGELGEAQWARLFVSTGTNSNQASAAQAN